ncbi:hypothetical protein HNP37_003830 [Flavobacterium nitrogenifigens]|uniref:Uncharacterized protein n=2 Tax=Flavobacterium TaxID=237 RepID=A0A7W7J0B6_9FLAO|nr:MULTISPECIES: hypothetical protein [Flavobacterium]MBB4803755.1 hypothetical protein [Flavobacterium nitrogenifigens]MBB6388440.1 hypothetical protein [Flavobacterium notoginsengisoli]
MKRTLYIAIIILIPNLFFAQIYKAKLIDYNTSKTPAYCSSQKSYGLLKFELQEKSHIKGEVVFIIQECPRELMDKVGKYKNDSIYTIKIENQADKKLSKIGSEICKRDYPKDKTNRFWLGYINIDHK